MVTPFQLHGRTVTDSGLYPWVIGSITRSLFFYGEATASRANRGAAAIAAYYSLFHLGLFLMFGCPRLLTENERNRINEGLDDGAADPNPQISHRNLVAFLERAVHSHGLPPNVLDAVRRAKDVRETINYGPRMLSWADGRITLENCAIQPTAVDAILAGIPRVYEDAIAWACRNGEDVGVWIQPF
jgi:hypothetical protein